MAPLVKEMLAKPVLVEQQKEAGGKDDVGVDVRLGQRRGDAADFCEGIHANLSTVTWP